MIDRIIGLLGLALALIVGLYSLAPADWPKMPTWVNLLGMAIGIMLIGVAVGLYFGGGENQSAFVTAKIPTSLAVRFDAENPLNLRAENIRRWYFLKNAVIINSVDLETKQPKQDAVAIWNLFIVFDRPTALHQLIITGGPSLPPFEVRVADPVHAIVVFSGDLSGKTVTAEAKLN